MSEPQSGRSGLSAVEERRLVLAAAASDGAARARIVELFLPAIGGIARLYRSHPRLDREDLVQEGVVGLLRALVRYDAAFGTPFWAYAAWWVRQAMQQLVAHTTRAVVLSDRALRMLARVKDARREHLQAHGRDPSTDEIAEATGLARQQVEDLLAGDRAAHGIDQPVADDPGSGTTLGGTLADPAATQQYDLILDRLEAEAVRDLCEGLGERERRVLFDHYGLGRAPMTLREIGDALGVSAERVRQIEVAALARLREAALGSSIAGSEADPWR